MSGGPNIGTDLTGVGMLVQAITNAPKSLAEAGDIMIGAIGKIPGTLDQFSKTLEEHQDRNEDRRIKQIREANMNGFLSEKDKEQLKVNAKEIVERNGGHLEEMHDEELFKLRKINELLNGNVENGGIRNQVANAVNGVKDVELKQNVFQHFDNSNFQ